MSRAHEHFHYKTLEEIVADTKKLGTDDVMKVSTDLSVLSTPVKVGKRTISNRFAVLPMEGCDSNLDGSPTERVERRYKRFAMGGSSLVWWEANSIVEEGRANPHAMFITEKNLDAFKKLLDETREAAEKSVGKQPLQIMQLTHSGRYSRPHGIKPLPLIAYHDPLLDSRVGLKGNEPVLTDEYLDSLVDKYVKVALLAQEAGFDGVDIKSCHRYLLSELLAAFTRPGKYGGSFENRTRLLLDAVKAVRAAVRSDFIVASRFNVFDAHPYPYGFGEGEKDMWIFHQEEPVKLVKLLCRNGVDLLTNSSGNPYYLYPQVTRPFDTSSMGIPVPEEHQLVSTKRLFDFTRLVQETAGTVPVIGNGYTWLRQWAPYFASYNIQKGYVAMLGFGRGSIAYPDAPKDIMTKGKMNPDKCCITCSRCTQIMRDQGQTGCVIRDSAIYAPLYRKYRAEAVAREAEK